MKAILKFDLSDFDDTKLHEKMIQATDFFHALQEIREYINMQIKGNSEISLNDLRDKFHEILSDNDIDLDKL